MQYFNHESLSEGDRSLICPIKKAWKTEIINVAVEPKVHHVNRYQQCFISVAIQRIMQGIQIEENCVGEHYYLGASLKCFTMYDVFFRLKKSRLMYLFIVGKIDCWASKNCNGSYDLIEMKFSCRRKRSTRDTQLHDKHGVERMNEWMLDPMARLSPLSKQLSWVWYMRCTVVRNVNASPWSSHANGLLSFS